MKSLPAMAAYRVALHEQLGHLDLAWGEAAPSGVAVDAALLLEAESCRAGFALAAASKERGSLSVRAVPFSVEEAAG